MLSTGSASKPRSGCSAGAGDTDGMRMVIDSADPGDLLFEIGIGGRNGIARRTASRQ